MNSPNAGEGSVLLNLLTSRPDRKDTRVFAHAAAETQTVIHDTYQAGCADSPTGRGTAFNAQESGFLEVFPRVASRPPKLLQDLESALSNRLRNNDKAVRTVPLVTKDRDPGMAANLSLEAHRQIFAAFIEGFSTYSSLLSRVQADFESALDQGLRCTMENVQLRIRIADEEAKRLKAQADLRSKIMAGELEYRKAAFARLQELKVRMDRAVKRASIAERELANTRRQEQRMRELVAKLKQQNLGLQELQRQEQAWAELPTSSHMAAMPVGALSKEDEDWLEAEYTSSKVPTSVDKSMAGDPSMAELH